MDDPLHPLSSVDQMLPATSPVPPTSLAAPRRIKKSRVHFHTRHDGVPTSCWPQVLDGAPRSRNASAVSLWLWPLLASWLPEQRQPLCLFLSCHRRLSA